MSELTPVVPKGSVRVRASGLPGAFDCAHRWEGDVIYGYRLPSSPRAVLGSALHLGTAVYDTACMQGDPVPVGDVADVVVQAIHKPKEDVSWKGSDLRPRDAEVIALDLFARYCTQWSPQFQFAAVELTVKPLTINCGDGVLLTLTGTLDRMRVVAGPNGKKRVKDLKSGKTAVVYDPERQAHRAATAKHRPQLGVYEILAAHTLDEEIDTTSDVLGLSTAGQRPIATAEVSGNRDLVLGTDEDPGLLDFLADNLRLGRFPPNPSSPLCSPKYCARWNRCRYHE